MAAPRIGITRSLSPKLTDDEIPFSYQTYHDRVREAGGEPVDLPSALATPPEQILDGLDGVIVAGGPDINPALYGQETHAKTEGISDARDALEIGLIRAAMARDLPVFAICRGHQALNVACGGPLLQHIEGDGHRATEEGESRFHDITVADGSKLAHLVGAGTVRTNSRHHQAVLPDGIAPGLIATAASPDGLIEGVESPAHRWVIGVQWHPERDEVKGQFRVLFADFIRAAGVQQQVAGSRG